MEESKGWLATIAGVARVIRGVPRGRLAAIVLIVCWMLAGAVSLFGLRKPKATFIPIPQVLTEVKDDKDGILFVASFPYATNDVAVAQYRKGLKYDLVRAGRTKVWLENSERGMDFKSLSVSQIGWELEFDDYPPASSLTIMLRGPKEALYCGDAEGYYRGMVWYWKDWITGELEPHERKPGVKIPCHYDTLRVQFDDGSESSFYIGAVSVPPHFEFLDDYEQYIPVDYEPIAIHKAWGIVIRYLLSVMGVVAGPAILGALLQGRRNYTLGILATLLLFSLLHFSQDYFVVKDVARRIWMSILTSMGPLLASHVGTFTAVRHFKRQQRISGAPPKEKS